MRGRHGWLKSADANTWHCTVGEDDKGCLWWDRGVQVTLMDECGGQADVYLTVVLCL